MKAYMYAVIVFIGVCIMWTLVDIRKEMRLTNLTAVEKAAMIEQKEAQEAAKERDKAIWLAEHERIKELKFSEVLSGEHGVAFSEWINVNVMPYFILAAGGFFSLFLIVFGLMQGGNLLIFVVAGFIMAGSAVFFLESSLLYANPLLNDPLNIIMLLSVVGSITYLMLSKS